MEKAELPWMVTWLFLLGKGDQMKLKPMALIVMLFFSASGVYTELHDRGGGLIYDDVLNITWLQDVQHSVSSGYVTDPRMNWYDANEWVENLVYYDSVRNIFWNDWRLPKAIPVSGNNFNYEFSYDGSTDKGYNNFVSELSHLYYHDLGNFGYYSKTGTFPQSGYGLENTGPFVNLKVLGPGGESYYSVYWTETDDAPIVGVENWSETSAWIFATHNGIQEGMGKEAPYLAWAVRDGDVIPHVHCVSTANELQEALNKASDNSTDDIIKIQKGIYYGNFVYQSSESNGLTIEGGYSDDKCNDRDVDPLNTTIDGKIIGRVLTINTNAVALDVIINGITIQNGYVGPADYFSRGGGLFVQTLGGNISLENNIFTKNYTYSIGGGLLRADKLNDVVASTISGG
jgi:hypothetical protein